MYGLDNTISDDSVILTLKYMYNNFLIPKTYFYFEGSGKQIDSTLPLLTVRNFNIYINFDGNKLFCSTTLNLVTSLSNNRI